MQDQIFHYKGKHLKEKLEKLIYTLTKKIQACNTRLDQLPKERMPSEMSYLRLENNIANNTADQKERSLLKYQVEQAEQSKRRAEYWIKECERTPRRVYLLDFKDLEWMDYV